MHRVPQVSHPSHLSSQPLRVELKHSCPVCPVSSLCRQAMAARCFADTGGLDSDDELADTGSQCAAAAAAAAHHQAVTAAAIAGSIQGSPLAAKVRPPAPPAVINTSSFPQGRQTPSTRKLPQTEGGIITLATLSARDEGIAGQANAVESHREERASSTSETMQPTALQPTAMEESPTTARSSGAQAPPDAAQELRNGYIALARSRGHKLVISPTYVFFL